MRALMHETKHVANGTTTTEVVKGRAGDTNGTATPTEVVRQLLRNFEGHDAFGHEKILTYDIKLV